MENTAIEQVEKLIDSHSLKGVIEMMAEICGENAQHITENWQDKKLSQSWLKDAAKLLSFRDKLNN